MRKIILLIITVFFCFSTKSQIIVEGIDINNEPSVEICQVVAYGKFLSKKVIISIDYGQEISFWQKRTIVSDTVGEEIVFNTVIDAINFVEKNGWTHYESLAITMTSSKVYHYYFRRKDTNRNFTKKKKYKIPEHKVDSRLERLRNEEEEEE